MMRTVGILFLTAALLGIGGKERLYSAYALHYVGIDYFDG